MNNSYWNKFYLNKKKTFKPSSFAVFVKKRLKKKIFINMIEIACGDGRDTFYFSKYFKKIISIDKSKTVINKNIKNNNYNKCKNTIFISKDFTKDIKDIYGKYNFVYARFYFHTINAKEENISLKNISKITNKNSIIAFEFRTDKDKMINKGKKISKNERLYTHYRRFINVKEFEKKLSRYKFKIVYKKVSNNLSIFKKDNPYLCRLMIKKI